jgi:hypothetical protein
LAGTSVVAGLISIAALFVLPGAFGVYGVILAAWAPRVLLYNWQPVRLAAPMLGESFWAVFAKNYRGVLVYLAGVGVFVVLRMAFRP